MAFQPCQRHPADIARREAARNHIQIGRAAGATMSLGIMLVMAWLQWPAVLWGF